MYSTTSAFKAACQDIAHARTLWAFLTIIVTIHMQVFNRETFTFEVNSLNCIILRKNNKVSQPIK